MPERGGEGAGALDPDAVVPEAEGLEGVVVPREGRGERGRALGPDVVLAEEEFLCGFGVSSEKKYVLNA